MSNQNKNNQQPYTLDAYTLQLPLRATTKQIQKVICINRLKHIWPTLPKEIQKQFPSTLSTLTSIPLGQSARTDTTNRFTADKFKIFLRRKLRLPLHPKPPTTCTCVNPKTTSSHVNTTSKQPSTIVCETHYIQFANKYSH